MLCSQRDKRTGRPCVGIDERVAWNGGAVEHVRYFCGAVESPAISIHFKNNRRRAAAFGCFFRPTQKHQERRRNLPPQRDHNYVAFVYDVARLSCLHSQAANQNENRDSLCEIWKATTHCVSLTSLLKANE